jgi:hypothetical protein
MGEEKKVNDNDWHRLRRYVETKFQTENKPKKEV